jgi:hypothetical protein
MRTIVGLGLLVGLAGLACCRDGPDVMTAEPDANGFDAPVEKLVDATFGDNRLVLYSADKRPLQLIRLNCVKSEGMFGLIINRSARKVVYRIDRCGGEDCAVDTIVDYSDANAGVFRFIECTEDPRSDDEPAVPFLQRTVRVLRDGSLNEAEKIVMEPRPAGETEIAQLTQDIIKGLKAVAAKSKTKDKDDEGSQLWDDLLELRNMGIANPDSVLAAFREIEKVCGPPTGEEYNWEWVRTEIEWVKELQTHQVRAKRD